MTKGLCQCGCGEPTSIAKHTVRTRNMVKGEPLRFKKGHCLKVKEIHNNRNRNTIQFTAEQLAEMEQLYRHGWSCDQLAVRFGCLSGSIQRRLVKRGVPMRPKKRWRRRAAVHSNGYIMWGGTYVHRIVAEAWRGTPLQPGENVHHKDGDKTNNHPDNLEIFASMTDHIRAEAWRTKWTAEQDNTLIQMRNAGYTAQVIADALGMPRYAVERRALRLVRYGVLDKLTNTQRRHSAPVPLSRIVPGVVARLRGEA